MVSAHPSLAISIISGGAIGTGPWKDVIKAITRQVMAIRSEYPTPLALNVVFQIPGEVFRPNFTGVRTGIFSRREERLVVQAAVPDSPDINRKTCVIAMLRKAIAEAEKFAIQEALPDTDLSGLCRLVDAFSDEPPE